MTTSDAADPGGRPEKKAMATILEPMVTAFVGPNPPVTVRFWDGSTLGPERAPATLTIRSPRALRRILYAPGELGAARAYVAGELDLDGDVYAALALRDAMAGQDKNVKVGLGKRGWLGLVRAAGSSGAIGPPPPLPPEEARLRGRRHSKERDAAAISLSR